MICAGDHAGDGEVQLAGRGLHRKVAVRIGPDNREDLQRVALPVLAQHPQRRVPAWLGCLSSRLRFLTGALLVGANLGGTVLEWTYAAEAARRT